MYKRCLHFLLFLTLSGCTGSFFGTKKNYVINGTVLQKGAHCGGVNLSDDMWRELRKPKPLSGKHLYIREGSVNDVNKPIIKEVVSDKNGRFAVQLPAGTYCITDEERKDREHYEHLLEILEEGNDYYSPIDKECLEKWLEKPLNVFEVKNDTVAVTLTVQEKCSWERIPCTSYKGPLPP